MVSDVFLCYDEKDEAAAERICELFEDNSIGCWFKSRDYSKDRHVTDIFDAIGQSRVLVLIHSKSCEKSESVIREINEVFSTPTKILIANVDSTSLSGTLEFYLKDKPSIDIYENPSKKLKQLVGDTSEMLSKSAGKVRVKSDTVKFFNEFKIPGFDYWKFVKIALPAVIVLVLVIWFVVIPSGQHTTDDGGFVMNVTDVDVKNLNGKFVYTVLGDAYNMPSDSDRYIMHFRFYDDAQNQVYEVNSTCDEFKGRVMATFNRNNDNITHATFDLVDFNDNLICSQNLTVK